MVLSMRCLMYTLAALAVNGADAAAQASVAGAPAQQADSGPVGQTDTTPPASRHSLSQVVVFPDGRPVRGATVFVSPVGGSGAGQARAGITDSLGRFTIDSLRAGDYELQVMYPGASRPTLKRMAVEGRTTGDIVVLSAAEPNPAWTILFLALYLSTIVLARWHNIAQSLDQILHGQLDALKTRLVTELGTTNAAEKQGLTVAIEEIRTRLNAGAMSDWRRFASGEFLFWSRGRENAAWAAIHEVERQLASYLAPPARVLSYLHVTQAQLRAINNPAAIAVADAIRASLPSQSGEVSTAAQDEERRALLGRAIAICYEERDKEFCTLMEWQNKASWLTLGALLIIGFLAVAAGHTTYFLAGGAGGFLSRVMRALKREDVALDYGASWTTLFLSPLFGALAGWFGVAIITLATQPNVNLLGDAFKMVDWNMPIGPITLSVAFMLGFSERFFDAVVGAVDRHAAGARAAEEAAKAAGAGTPTRAPRTAPGEAAGAAPAAGAAAVPPPSSAGGAKIDLPDGPMPVQAVSGKVVLEKPATAATGVNLSTSRPDVVAKPAALSIPVGETEADFDIVPNGSAPAGVVRVTARIGDATVSDSIEFV
jgi:hypothetical protein